MIIRNLKALGLALVAVFALTAVAASAAQAAEFHAEEAPVFFEGSQVEQHIFTVDKGTVKCNTATFTGSSATATTATVTLTPVYSTCKFAGTAADVKMNGCDYLFHLSSATTATVDVVCSGGAEIEVESTTTNCIVHVPAQNGLSHVILASEGTTTTRDITATVTVAGIHYTEVGSECKFNGVATTNGTYNGTATIKGFKGQGGAQQGIWVE
jgi:hypothetical protein